MHQIWYAKFMESYTHISQENVGTARPCTTLRDSEDILEQ